MSFQQIFYDSYDRIFGRQACITVAGNHFYDRFYERFVNASPEVAEAFQHTDMAHQKGMLKRSLLYSVGFIVNPDERAFIERIARSHDRYHHNIAPHLYDLWLECMIANVREFDPGFSDDVDLSWRLAMAPCISLMKFRYDHSAPSDLPARPRQS